MTDPIDTGPAGPFYDFGTALEFMEDSGELIAREGWNGPGMFLFHVKQSQFDVSGTRLEGAIEAGKVVTLGAHIMMKTANGVLIPWLASQTDLLAKDWYMVARDDVRAAIGEAPQAMETPQQPNPPAAAESLGGQADTPNPAA